jgi:hypothetical protein
MSRLTLPKDGVQLARAAPRPLELPSSCVAALLGEQPLSYPYVGLSERDAFLAGCFYQLLAHPVVEAGIGGKADVLLLDGGVNVDPLELAGLYDPKPQTGPDRLLKQFLGSGLTDEPSPAAHARRIDRHLVREVLHPREVLPARVLHPTPEYGPVAEVVGVLEVVQGHHQPRGDPGPTRLSTVAHAKLLVEAAPVDLRASVTRGCSALTSLASSVFIIRGSPCAPQSGL